MIPILLTLAYFSLIFLPYTLGLSSGKVVYRSTQTVTTRPLERPQASVSPPHRLQIPQLGIDSTIEQVGLTSSGDMGVPTNVANTGWYKDSSRPGELGTAVIDGHLDGPSGEPGVFLDLYKIKKGDVIIVTNADKRINFFVVRELRTYAQNERPREVFTSSDGRKLNLITCTGPWDNNIQRFSQRLVVFTERAASN